MTEFLEAEMTINGTLLTAAQAMTVRVALGAFAMDLRNNGLGEDVIGNEITQGYLIAIRQLYHLMRVAV
jgi:hypothetical protein